MHPLYELIGSIVVAVIFILCLVEAAEENWKGRLWNWLTGPGYRRWCPHSRIRKFVYESRFVRWLDERSE